MDRTKTQFLVIGGGLAGATAAFLLQKAGKDVVVLERALAADKDKLCAGLVTPRAAVMLRRIYGISVESLYKSAFNSMRCTIDGRSVQVNDIFMRSVERRELDAFALQAFLDAGGTLLDGMGVRSVDERNREVVAFGKDGKPRLFAYETLIAADGALSSVRTALAGAPGESVLMLETTVEKTKGDELVMAYDSRFKGYSWYTPVGERAKLGCACFSGSALLDEQLKGFASELGITYAKRRGAFAPTGNDVLLRQGSCYFIGDAAGLICPPSGEGIYYALFSAWQLVQALLSNASYEALMARKCASIRRQYRTRDLFFSSRFINAALGAARCTPYGDERAVKFALRHMAGFAC